MSDQTDSNRAAFEASTARLSQEINEALDKLKRNLDMHEKDIEEAEKGAIDEENAAFIDFLATTAVA